LKPTASDVPIEKLRSGSDMEQIYYESIAFKNALIKLDRISVISPKTVSTKYPIKEPR
jgi:hypothetical protein